MGKQGERHAMPWMDLYSTDGQKHPSILTKFTSAPATNLEAAECAVDPTVASQQEGPDLEPTGLSMWGLNEFPPRFTSL